MVEKKSPISCDWKTGPAPKGKKTTANNKSRLYKHRDFRWQGIKIEKYKQGSGGWADIVRQTLIGNHGETCKFHLRYFEIMPGGYSSLETHKHEHVVIGIRGNGRVKLNRRSIKIGFLDVLYIAPHTAHRLYNPNREPFGFFCIVNSKRDKPTIL